MQHGSLKIVKNRRGVKVWRLQWRENGRGRTRILGEFSKMTRAEANVARQKIISPLNKRVSKGDTSALDIRTYVENEYLTTRNWKESTSGTTEQIIETHILREFENRALATVSRKELQALLNDKAAKGLSKSLVHHIGWQLKAIFNLAESDGLVEKNPGAELVLPRCKEPGPKRIITVDEIQGADIVLEPRERLMFRLAVYCGLRPGEIVGLKCGDIQDGVTRISRRVYRNVIGTPKSEKSKRRIPSDDTQRLLEDWKAMLPNSGPDCWVFPSEATNTPISYSNVYRRKIRPALEKVGLAGVNFQILRRTWANVVSQEVKDAAVCAHLAGHSVDVHEKRV
jgi:integrase